MIRFGTLVQVYNIVSVTVGHPTCECQRCFTIDLTILIIAVREVNNLETGE